MKEYTPEPWNVQSVVHNVAGLGYTAKEIQIEAKRPGSNNNFGDVICVMTTVDELGGEESNARRIVACVNACQDFETYQLEGLAKDPLSASGLRLGLLVERTDERDKARDIIKDLIEWAAVAHSSYGPDCQCADCKQMRMILTKGQDLLQTRKE